MASTSSRGIPSNLPNSVSEEPLWISRWVKRIQTSLRLNENSGRSADTSRTNSAVRSIMALSAVINPARRPFS